MNSVFGRAGGASNQATALGGYTGRGGGNRVPTNRPPRPGEPTLLDQILLGGAVSTGHLDPNAPFTYVKGSQTTNYPGGFGGPVGGGGVSRHGQVQGLAENAPGQNAPGQVGPGPTPLMNRPGPSYMGGRMPGTKTTFNMGQLDPSQIRRRVG